MKHIFTFFLYVYCLAAGAQSGTWTWMKGDSTINSIAVYGQQGIADSTNIPPALYSPCNWTDLDGNFWLFGGKIDQSNLNSDLWMFSPQTNMWTWIKGPGISNNKGLYGTKGVSSINNMPGARGFSAPTWVDNYGNLWLMGGAGFDSTGNYGYLNDLWKYQIATNEWTWIAGSDSANDPGYAGTWGTEEHRPHARAETRATWVDNDNSLWFFGGSIDCGFLGDIWKFDTQINKWTNVKGNYYTCLPFTETPLHGASQEESYNFTPGGREIYNSYYDKDNGYLWIFSGQSYVSQIFGPSFPADVWRYNVNTNMWSWIRGMWNTTWGDYNQYCQSAGNIPPGKYLATASWKDNCGHLWFYGGMSDDQLGSGSQYYADLWLMNCNSKDFTWVSGPDTINFQGNYGLKETPSSINNPPALVGSVAFTDNNGHLWMFGGAKNPISFYNTMWKYIPDYSCSIPPEEICNTTAIAEASIFSTQFTLYPNPTNTDNTIISFTYAPLKPYYIELYSMDGKLLLTDKATDKVYTLNTSGLTNGIYLVKITTTEHGTNQRLCILK